MSLHASVVAVQGNLLPQLSSFFAQAGYRVVNETMVHTGAEAARLLDRQSANRDHVVKAAYLQNGWTVLLDPELVLFDKNLLGRLSNESQANVLGWICDGVSGTYGFIFFGKGQTRSVLSVAGRLAEDIGQALIEESGTEWGKASEDDVLRLSEKLGAPYRYMKDDLEYHIFLLDESKPEPRDDAASSPSPSVQSGPGSVGSSDAQRKPKKWWQFWL